MKKRLLSLILALIMLAGYLPYAADTVFAASGNVCNYNSQSYTSLQAAINAAAKKPNEINRIMLTPRVTIEESVTIPSGARIFLDMRDNVWSPSSVKTSTITVESNAEFTLSMSGTSTIYAGQGTSVGSGEYRGGAIYNKGGNVLISNGTISGSKAGSDAAKYTIGGAIYSQGFGVVQLNGTTITDFSAKQGSGIYNEFILFLSSSSKIINCKGTGIYSPDGTVRIRGTSKIGGSGMTYAVEMLKGDFEVTDNAILSSSIKLGSAVNVEITGGWFHDKVQNPPQGYIASGVRSDAPDPDAPYTIGIVSVMAGSTGYAGISEAAAAIAGMPASSRPTISLMKDISENAVFGNGTFTLDLAGHTLKYASETDPTIKVNAGAELTLKDSVGTGKVIGGAGAYSDAQGDYNFANAVYNLGTVNFVSGTISGSGSTAAAQGGAVMNGGTFNMSSSAQIVNSSASLGGGVYNAGVLNMGGNSKITGCTASKGDAVYNSGKFVIRESALCEGRSVDKLNTLVGSGSVYVQGGKISGITAGGSLYVSSGTAEELAVNGSCEISGGNLGKLNIYAGGSGDITGGTFSGKVDSAGTLRITGGVFLNNASVSGNGKLTIGGGWYTSALSSSYLLDGYTFFIDKEHAPDSRTTVTVNTVVITLVNGTSGTYSIISKVVPENTKFTKKNSIFTGWNTEENGKGKAYKPGDTVSNSIRLYAQWKVDADAERTLTIIDTYNSYNKKIITQKSSKFLITDPGFVRYNYEISGFNTREDGKGQSVSIGATLDLGDSPEATLYVQWREKTYVTFDETGTRQIVFIDPTNSNPNFLFLTDNTTLTISSNGFTRSGYVFDCWCTTSDGTGTKYVIGSKYTPQSNESVLYAMWKSKTTSEHYTQGGEKESGGGTIQYDPRRSGGDSEPQNNGPKLIEHTLTFTDTGTLAGISGLKVTTTDPDVLLLPAFENTVFRSGYKFVSWNTRSDGSGTTYKSNSVFTFTGIDATLYAQWTKSNPGGGGEDDPGSKDDPGNNNNPKKDEKEIIEELEKRKREEEIGDKPVNPSKPDDPGNRQPGYADVYRDKYYTDAVAWAIRTGVALGKGYDKDGNIIFDPNGACTRAHIITFIWRAMGSPEPVIACPFRDVPAGSYYEKAVAWGYEKGIVNGNTDGTFGPNQACTRAHAVSFLYRAEVAPVGYGGVPFKDVPANAYYYDAVEWAVSHGVTNGTTDTTFSPGKTCTRAQIVTFLYRIYGE